jgi:hypothetical protein
MASISHVRLFDVSRRVLHSAARPLTTARWPARDTGQTCPLLTWVTVSSAFLAQESLASRFHVVEDEYGA